MSKDETSPPARIWLLNATIKAMGVEEFNVPFELRPHSVEYLRADAARQRITQLENALREFGVHAMGCDSLTRGKGRHRSPCDCGLYAALTGISEQGKPSADDDDDDHAACPHPSKHYERE